MEANEISLKLSKDEALVLFEFLSRFDMDEILKIEDQAEERVLWNICANLESLLAEPFMENYLEIIQGARERVRDSDA